MDDIVSRLKSGMESGTADSDVLSEAVREISDLRRQRDKMEILLITLARTGWPWDEEGKPNGILAHCRDGYAQAMIEARELLGLDFRSRLTRTEPKT